MNHHASGPFDVKLNLLEPYNQNDRGWTPFDRQAVPRRSGRHQPVSSVGSASGSGGYGDRTRQRFVAGRHGTSRCSTMRR